MKWEASDWVMVILASSIPLSIIIIPVLRWITGQTLSDNASSVLNNLMTGIGVGLLTIISQKKKENKL